MVGQSALEKIRSEIDKFDAVLADTLSQRFETAARIAVYKKENGLAVYQPEREAEVLERLERVLGDKAYGAEVKELFKQIFKMSRRVQFSEVFHHNVVLIGFMGTGKTTVGQYLANITGYIYYDVDKIIETRAAQPIDDIFKVHGEAYFRALESEVIKELRSLQNAVIACGGGAVLDSANVKFLKEKGKLIWLKAELETVYPRISAEVNRPLVKGAKFDDIKALLNRREETYHCVADFEMITDGKTVSEVGDEILSLLLT